MKSRYGIWILSICWIGLAGCSNWQNRINSANGPGSAASLSAAPSASGSPLMQGPDPSFGEPPPPVPPPPSDPGMTLAPLGGAPPQRLDLSSADQAPAAAPQKMYNLESSGASSSKASSSKSSAGAKSGSGSSTISRLASKSKPAEVSAPSKPKGSAIDRLSAQASKPKVDEKAEEKAEVTEPVRKASAPPAAEESSPAVDTTFLAQPVRKGSADDSNSGKNGPQSSVIPKENTLFNGRNKPVIYPVSNPATDEPVDITQFS